MYQTLVSKIEVCVSAYVHFCMALGLEESGFVSLETCSVKVNMTILTSRLIGLIAKERKKKKKKKARSTPK